MASDSEDFEKDFENLKIAVKNSFAVVYATLKARELKTLRQIDAIRKQCQNDKTLQANCVQNIHVSYDNESTLLDNINNYGVIDLEKLNFDCNTFAIEDYVSPVNDHMYSYKCIDDLTTEDGDLRAIEEAAIKQITNTKGCVCFVNIRTEDVSRKFREEIRSPLKPACDSSVNVADNGSENSTESPDVTIDVKSECSDSEVKKIDPTDEWLNTIKNQTETEPTQTNDVMEHSTIACS